MQAPVGPIYFTGEHTSEKFNGYVHGAYFSGPCEAFAYCLGDNIYFILNFIDIEVAVILLF